MNLMLDVFMIIVRPYALDERVSQSARKGREL